MTSPSAQPSSSLFLPYCNHTASSPCASCLVGIVGYSSLTIFCIGYTLYEMYLRPLISQKKSTWAVFRGIFSSSSSYSSSPSSSPSAPSSPASTPNRRRRTEKEDYTLPPGVSQILLGNEKLDQLHKEALEAGEPTYIDPATGFQCFTQAFHAKKKECCGNKCRHCPFEHVNVPKQ